MNIIQKSLGFLAAWTPGLAASAATLISTADTSLPTSATAGGLSASAWMTPNGQFIAFESDADNLISGPHRTGVVEVYLRDRTAGTLQRISQGQDIVPGRGSSASSGSPSVSTNGQWVAFRSLAGNLVSGDSLGSFTTAQIFLHNTASNQNVLVTSGLNSSGGDKDSRQPLVSANGQVVVFESLASNLVTGDTNGVADIFAYDVASGTLSLVSVNASGTGPASGASQLVDVSADGRYVLFTSKAGDVVTGCTNKQGEVFVRDLQQGITLWASAGAAGFFTQDGPAIASQTPAMDASGQHVVYQAYNAANVFCLYADLQGTT